eukprot:m.383963 g.383963  ORF g.383963 m.383963 type:complete len:692 (+) comp56261_c0_seq1:101-2176(+)
MATLGSLLAAAIVVLAVSHTSDAVGGWVLGGLGQSCDMVCGFLNDPVVACKNESQRSITTLESFHNVRTRIGYSYSPRVTFPACLSFSNISTPLGSMFEDPAGACFFNATSALCGDIPVGQLKRICCCSDLPCIITPPKPIVDCVVSQWGTYGSCSATCGVSARTRSRTITVAPLNGGNACPSLQQTVVCNGNACPVDCIVSMWSSYSTCSKTCGFGSQTRSRTVVTQARFGGLACPVLREIQNCNSFECPIDCVVSSWSSYGLCSLTCGGGQAWRSRSVLVSAMFGGQACPSDLTSTIACNQHACPIDCMVSAWSGYGECSQSCGTGSQSRWRSVTNPASNGGHACPDLVESQPCNEQECPVDCVVSAWSDFGACSHSCGPAGLQGRHRTVTTAPLNGGAACPSLVDHQPCNEFPCPVDCTTTSWGNWGRCSKSCGPSAGVQTRTRKVAMPASNGGIPCGSSGISLVEARNCPSMPCPVDCAVSAWSSFGSCSLSCGGGSQTRWREVVSAPIAGGKACPGLTDSQWCNNFVCPGDCVVSEWSGWSTCKKSCSAGAVGVTTRTRHVVVLPMDGGMACPALHQENECDTNCEGWVLGPHDESCTQACAAARGQPCNAASMSMVTTPEIFDFVASLLPGADACNDYDISVDGADPGIWHNICYFGQQYTSCEASYSDQERLCCCSNDGCPLAP